MRSYPGFRLKRALRWSFDCFQSDWVFDQLLSTAVLRRAAQWVYFQRKAGPLGERGTDAISSFSSRIAR